jgi:hypothetical protein
MKSPIVAHAQSLLCNTGNKFKLLALFPRTKASLSKDASTVSSSGGAKVHRAKLHRVHKRIWFVLPKAKGRTRTTTFEDDDDAEEPLLDYTLLYRRWSEEEQRIIDSYELESVDTFLAAAIENPDERESQTPSLNANFEAVRE